MDQLVKKVTLPQIKEYYNNARRKEEEEREKKRKEEERARQRREKEEEERRKTMGKEKLKREEARREARWNQKEVSEVIKAAHLTHPGSLHATLKRARLLTNKKITMEDVKKWRLEKANKEKKTNRRSTTVGLATKRRMSTRWICSTFKTSRRSRH